MAEIPKAQGSDPMNWDDRFKNNETPWERPGLHPAITHWIEAGEFQAGESGIIPGCGRAPELFRLASLGVHMTGIDLSQTAIDWQNQHLESSGLTAKLQTANVLKYQPDTRLDFVSEQTFLCAIPPNLRESYEAAAHRWLKPGGRFYALFRQKDERGGPPYGCSLNAMHQLFPASRWIWPEESAFTAHPHPRLDGKPELAGILIRK